MGLLNTVNFCTTCNMELKKDGPLSNFLSVGPGKSQSNSFPSSNSLPKATAIATIAR